MKTISTMVVTAALTLIGATALAVHLYWGEAVREGKVLHVGRGLVERAARRRAGDAPMVSWIGDSTLMRGPKKLTPYPIVVAERLAGDQVVNTSLFAQSAVGPFVDYVVMGKLLDAEPDLIVIVANLRIMALRAQGARGVLGMASFIPAREMWRAMWLPWHHRQVTIPRLFLAHALSWRPFAEIFYFFEGLKLMFRDRLYASSLKLGFVDGVARRNLMLHRYADPIEKPVIRMLGASVDLAVRRGRRVVVMMTPMPIEALRRWNLYTDQIVEQIEVVRRTVEQAGGRFVDLHDALAPNEFRDNAGHFNEKGVDRVAEFARSDRTRGVVASLAAAAGGGERGRELSIRSRLLGNPDDTSGYGPAAERDTGRIPPVRRPTLMPAGDALAAANAAPSWSGVAAEAAIAASVVRSRDFRPALSALRGPGQHALRSRHPWEPVAVCARRYLHGDLGDGVGCPRLVVESRRFVRRQHLPSCTGSVDQQRAHARSPADLRTGVRGDGQPGFGEPSQSVSRFSRCAAFRCTLCCATGAPEGWPPSPLGVSSLTARCASPS